MSSPGLLLILYKATYNCESESVTTFNVVVQFIKQKLYKVGLRFESVDEILKCDHSNVWT